MSRIRSIHPGLWTDEAFMSLSAYGRLLLMGIWTEAFDDGVFEWKPLTLKARIFPVDMVDVNDLLLELVEHNLISRLESHPKRPGVIRNFQRYQRPKKPNSSGMLADEWLDYVGAKATPEASDDDSVEQVPNQYGTGSEKSLQMEDGGGNRSSSLRSESNLRESASAENSDFQNWFSSWPSFASDDERSTREEWGKLSKADQQSAASNTDDYIAASAKGGRKTICAANRYLRERRWERLNAQQPKAQSPPMSKADKEAAQAEYRRKLIEHNNSW